MSEENNTTENHNTEGGEQKKRCHRKTSHKVMVATALAAVVGAAAFAGAAQSSGWGDGYGCGKYDGRHGHMMKMFQEFDADGDGKVTKSELDTARMSRFSDADSDGSSSLNLDEFQGLWQNFMRSRMVDKFQMLDDDGDGQVSEREFSKPFNMALRYMDRNDDGAISMKEIKRKRYWGYDDDDDDRYERNDDDDDDDRYERDDDDRKKD